MSNIKLKIKKCLTISSENIWKHKFIYLLILIILIVSSVLMFSFFQLFNGGNQDDQLKNDWLSNNDIVSTQSVMKRNTTQNDPFVNKIFADYKSSQNSTNSGQTFYYIFGYKDIDYYDYLINISEKEWKYFNIFHLGQYWKDKWHNKGPLEELAKQFNTETSYGKNSNFHIFLFKNDSSSESVKYNTNIRTFIDNILVIHGSGDNKETYLSDEINPDKESIPIIPTSNFTKKILQNGSVSTDAGATRGLRYDQLSNAPFILTIKGGKISIINALLTQSQLADLG